MAAALRVADVIRSCWESYNWVLSRFARDAQWRLEGQLGFLALLHTWTQRLKLHFHVHGIVPGGVWREDSQTWVPCRGQWLFRQDSLGEAFRNRFLRRLCTLRNRGKLAYGGRAAALAADAACFAAFRAPQTPLPSTTRSQTQS